jgi:CRP/FNR family transcriptional regulator, anaerobic regulatory protein
MSFAQAVSTVPAGVNFSALAVCRGLGQKATSRVAEISSLRKLLPGEVMFAEGDDADAVYEVVRGMLKLYKLLPDGRRQVTGFLSAGHLVGLAHEQLYLYTAEAITPVTACRYPRARFERLVDEVPGFAMRLLAATSDELRAAQDQMVLLGRKAAEEKVASFLQMMGQQRGGGEDPDEVLLPMSRADIADYVGLTLETVSRTLGKLKNDGVIAIPYASSIRLCDRHRLQLLAAGGRNLERQ